MCTQEYTQPKMILIIFYFPPPTGAGNPEAGRIFFAFLLFSRFFPALARYTKQRNFFLPKSPHSGPAAVTS